MNIFSNLSKDVKRVILLFGLGLFIRLIALPFSTTTDSDAVTRVYQAWFWLDNPRLITHGIWGPLHTYLIAASMWLVEDRVFPPILINILFSAATAIPLYFFTKNEFGEKACWFVPCAFLFYPVAFRNSLMALSETPCAFFIALSLLFISLSRKENGSWKHALMAGLSLTLATMLRYEAWILIPLFGIILWKKPKLLFVFCISSAIFPTFWMIGNQIHFGDPLYSINYQTKHELSALTQKGEMTTKIKVIRFLIWQGILMTGMSIIAFLLSIYGAIISVVKKRANSIYLIPFIGLYISFVAKVLSGSLSLQARYSLILGMLILPFASETFNNIYNKKRLLLSFSIIATMIPFSYLPTLMSSLQAFVLESIPTSKRESPESTLEAIPRLPTNTKAISEAVNENLNINNDRLVVVGLYFSSNNLVSFSSRLHPKKIARFPNGFYPISEFKKLSFFFDDHQTGLIVFDKSKAIKNNSIDFVKNSKLVINNSNKVLSLDTLIDTENFVIYRYLVQPGEK